MKVVAETENGFLIEATKSEVKDILGAVYGTPPKEITIGQKIPAIDYASTIQKINILSSDYNFKNIFLELDSFTKHAAALKETVERASSIEV